MIEETKHGVVFFDPKRGFIQVRDRYFCLKQELRSQPGRVLQAGHFTEFLSDAKNNIPSRITPRDLRNLQNIEEVGLQNIELVYYDEEMRDWRWDTRERCPTCGQETL